MNVYQLQSFVNVAEAGNIKKAAEDAFISRQAASRAIRTLEEELCFSLFQRSKGGVRLTAEGEVLLPYAKDVLSSFSELNRTATALSVKTRTVLRLNLCNVSLDLFENKIAAFMSGYGGKERLQITEFPEKNVFHL